MSGIAPILGALKYLPASAGVKLLQKYNPKFKNYFATAAAYGFDANRALDYLNDRFESDETKNFKGQLAQGAAQGNLRPDEQVARQQISQSELPGKALRTIGAYGGAALAGGLPGVAGQAAGDLMSRTKPKEGQAPQPQQAQQQSMSNIIREYSPELDQRASQEISSGRSPEDTTQLLRSLPKFNRIIGNIEDEQGFPFEQLLQGIYGSSQQGQQQAQPQQAGSGDNKQQFMQGLNQLAQSLQSLRKR